MPLSAVTMKATDRRWDPPALDTVQLRVRLNRREVAKMPEDRMSKEFDRVPPRGSKYIWLTQNEYLNGGGQRKPKNWFYSKVLGKKNGTYAMYYELQSVIVGRREESDCPDTNRPKRVFLESRNQHIQSLIAIAQKLPTLKAILAEIARKATHDVRILIEYGMVSGGNGQTIRAGESVATEGKIDIQDIGWGAFQGLKLDRCIEMHLIKMRNVGDRKSEILTISHEIGAHIAEMGHPGWGLSTNPYYDRRVGAGNGETPTSGSPAEALMKDLDLLVK